MRVFLSLLLLVLGHTMVTGQIITTYAGGGTSTLDSVLSTMAKIDNPGGMRFDKGNNLLVAACVGNKLFKVKQDGTTIKIAGTGTAGFNGDGGNADTSLLNLPGSVAADSNGNIYIPEIGGNRIRKITSGGIITTFAGTGVAGYSGDSGVATSAQINNPQDVCIDKFGNVYFSEYIGQRIRKVTPTGIISTYAGNGLPGYSGNGCRADTSRIGGVAGIHVDTLGNLYFCNISEAILVKISPDGIMQIIAGIPGAYLYNGDGILATSAQLYPLMVAMDNDGNLIVSDRLNYRVRKIDRTTSLISTIAGNGTSGISGDGGLATSAQLSAPNCVAVDSCNNVYISDANGDRIRKVTFDMCPTTSVPAVATAVGISVVPNPAREEVTISSGATIKEVTITDITGRVLVSATPAARATTIGIGHLPAGVYLVRVNGTHVQRLVKE